MGSDRRMRNFIIGPGQPCSLCGEVYGQHSVDCPNHADRPENWPISKKVRELAKSTKPDKERLQVLINLVADLAEELE